MGKEGAAFLPVPHSSVPSPHVSRIILKLPCSFLYGMVYFVILTYLVTM